jgi:hypothetical protein
VKVAEPRKNRLCIQCHEREVDWPVVVQYCETCITARMRSRDERRAIVDAYGVRPRFLASQQSFATQFGGVWGQAPKAHARGCLCSPCVASLLRRYPMDQEYEDVS